MDEHEQPPDAAAVAADIAGQLQETNPAALAQIERLVQRIGAEAALALLEDTQQVEAQGGLLVRDRAGSSSTWPGAGSPVASDGSSSRPAHARGENEPRPH